LLDIDLMAVPDIKHAPIERLDRRIKNRNSAVLLWGLVHIPFYIPVKGRVPWEQSKNH
jgi:hypothetical protein